MLAQLSWNGALRWGGWCGCARAGGWLAAMVVGAPGLGVLGCGLGVGVAYGQCEMTWQEGEGFPGMIKNLGSELQFDGLTIRALATWDLDGPGPLPERLVAGGRFKAAGDRLIKNIASWDGEAWSAMGSIEEYVGDLCEFDGELYACTYTEMTNGTPHPVVTRVFKWHGMEGWMPVGGEAQDGPLYELHAHEGHLIAAGEFKKSGAKAMNSIMRLDGGVWQPLGDGIGSKTLPNTTAAVFALGSFDGDLIVSGYFTSAMGYPGNSVARWNGQSWTALGAGIDGIVRGLEVIDGQLLVAGSFAKSGTSPVSCLWPDGMGSSGSRTRRGTERA